MTLTITDISYPCTKAILASLQTPSIVVLCQLSEVSLYSVHSVTVPQS